MRLGGGGGRAGTPGGSRVGRGVVCVPSAPGPAGEAGELYAEPTEGGMGLGTRLSGLRDMLQKHPKTAYSRGSLRHNPRLSGTRTPWGCWLAGPSRSQQKSPTVEGGGDLDPAQPHPPTTIAVYPCVLPLCSIIHHTTYIGYCLITVCCPPTPRWLPSNCSSSAVQLCV